MGIEAYTSHNDQHGAAIRRVAAAYRADRARMLATMQESDSGIVTLYMPRLEVQRRLWEARLFTMGRNQR